MPVKARFLPRPLVLLLVFLLSASPSLYADDNSQEGEKEKELPKFVMDEVVVTATGTEEPILKVPRNVTVITSEDIEQAPSNNVVDLLARQANLNLLSFFGTDKRATVDIRGFGSSASSNVLVMVDGIRFNPPDLAGPDYSTIPLEDIERIEVVRGAGSVLYGDGAVGGVVNIITKKGKKKPEGRLYASYGSYDTYDLRGSFRGSTEKLNFKANGGYYDTDGYRDNGFLRKKDFSSRLGYALTDSLAISASYAYHNDKQGFPGGVSIDDKNSPSRRRRTNTPNDMGETTDVRTRGGINADLKRWGELRIDGGFRNRENDFILGFTPQKSKDDQTSKIDEDTKNLYVNYVKEYEFWDREHTFQCGGDYYKTDYVSTRVDQNERKNGEIRNFGLFFMNQWSILQDLSARFGFRFNHYEGTFRNDQLEQFNGEKVWINGEQFDRNYDRTAYDIGVVYSLSEYTTFFASYATSFRIPNVDEFALAAEDLEPQEGKHIEIGGRHQIKGKAELSLTLFHIEIEDEIFFDPVSRVNRNFEDETRRRGVEVDARAYPIDTVYLWANYAYTEAKFEKLNTSVPLVPEHQASFGFEWQVVEPLLFSMTGRYVGSRFDGNDFTNDRFRKLDPYTTFDCKATYIYKKFKLFAGVNNIFDERYSTVAFSESYFTMPTRNFYAGLELRL